MRMTISDALAFINEASEKTETFVSYIKSSNISIQELEALGEIATNVKFDLRELRMFLGIDMVWKKDPQEHIVSDITKLGEVWKEIHTFVSWGKMEGLVANSGDIIRVGRLIPSTMQSIEYLTAWVTGDETDETDETDATDENVDDKPVYVSPVEDSTDVTDDVTEDETEDETEDTAPKPQDQDQDKAEEVREEVKAEDDSSNKSDKEVKKKKGRKSQTHNLQNSDLEKIFKEIGKVVGLSRTEVLKELCKNLEGIDKQVLYRILRKMSYTQFFKDKFEFADGKLRINTTSTDKTTVTTKTTKIDRTTVSTAECLSIIPMRGEEAFTERKARELISDNGYEIDEVYKNSDYQLTIAEIRVLLTARLKLWQEHTCPTAGRSTKAYAIAFAILDNPGKDNAFVKSVVEKEYRLNVYESYIGQVRGGVCNFPGVKRILGR